MSQPVSDWFSRGFVLWADRMDAEEQAEAADDEEEA